MIPLKLLDMVWVQQSASEKVFCHTCGHWEENKMGPCRAQVTGIVRHKIGLPTYYLDHKPEEHGVMEFYPTKEAAQKNHPCIYI